MTRAEALAFVIEPMPPARQRQMVREALLNWPQEDQDAWHKMKDAERKRDKRAEKKQMDAAAEQLGNVRSDTNNGTGRCPVSTEDTDRTTSGFNESSKPDSAPSPQVSPLHPPSSPAPVHTHAREAEPDEKHLPDGSKKTRPNTETQVVAHCLTLELPSSDGHAIWAKWEGNGFTNNGKRMKNWHQVIVSWKLHGYLPSQRPSHQKPLNGHVNGKPKTAYVDRRQTLDADAFLAHFKGKYRQLSPDFCLAHATDDIIDEYLADTKQ